MSGLKNEPRKFKCGDAVQTRDGRKARIVCDDMKGRCPVVALIGTLIGEEAIFCSSEGRYAFGVGDHSLDLIPAPRRQTVWVNLYNDLSASVWPSRDEADTYGSKKRVGRIRVELEEGRFDD